MPDDDLKGAGRRARRRLRHFVVPLLAAPACVGCQKAPAQTGPIIDIGAPSGVVWPSTIVITSEDTASAPHLVLPAEPLLSIGRAEGDSMYLFSNLEGALVLRDGTVVATDRGSASIRWYDRDGRFVLRVGRRGAGPGEFRWPLRPERCGEGLLAVVDLLLGRVSFLFEDGSLSDVQRLPESLVARDVRCDGEGRLYAKSNNGQPPQTLGPYQMPVRITEVSSNRRSRPLALTRVSGDDRYRRETNDMPRPLGGLITFAAGHGRVYIADESTFAIGIWNTDGQPVQRWFLDALVRPLDAKILSAYQDDWVRTISPGTPQGDAWARKHVESFEFPSTLPAISDMLVDPSGHLWVEGFEPSSEWSRTWIVFSEQGTVRALVSTPPSLRISDVSQDQGRIVGIWTDKLGVEYVHVYAITWPTQP